MYKLVFTKQAHKLFRRIPDKVAIRIRKGFDHLAKDPFAENPNITKLQNRPGYRLRVGDWRVIFEIREDELVILVLKIASRGEIYR